MTRAIIALMVLTGQAIASVDPTNQIAVSYDYIPEDRVNVLRALLVDKLDGGVVYQVIEVNRGTVSTGEVVKLYMKDGLLEGGIPEDAILVLERHQSSINASDVWYEQFDGPIGRSIISYSNALWREISAASSIVLSRQKPDGILPVDQAIQKAVEESVRRYGASSVISLKNGRVVRRSFGWEIPLLVRMPISGRDHVYLQMLDYVTVDDAGIVQHYLADRHAREVGEDGYSVRPVEALIDRFAISVADARLMVSHEVVCGTNTYRVPEISLELPYEDLFVWWDEAQPPEALENQYVRWLRTLDPGRDCVVLKGVLEEVGPYWQNLWLANARNGIRFAIDLKKRAESSPAQDVDGHPPQ
ncbi:MAG: hypothetical protein KA248_02220 [Kiritimatiellae bacterium]|nr:hypothetical protein [Kiritimatiellia bacterium]